MLRYVGLLGRRGVFIFMAVQSLASKSQQLPRSRCLVYSSSVAFAMKLIILEQLNTISSVLNVVDFGCLSVPFSSDRNSQHDQ
ncbi:hypothetical protein BJ875DRAFT_466305, partial [Amylocarpus encephaloides]